MIGEENAISEESVGQDAEAADVVLLAVLGLVLPRLGALRAVEDVLEEDVRRELVAGRSLREKKRNGGGVQFPGFDKSLFARWAIAKTIFRFFSHLGLLDTGGMEVALIYPVVTKLESIFEEGERAR